MTFLIVLALGIVLLLAPLPRAWAQGMPTAEDVCGVEPSGAAMPRWVDWDKCMKKFRQGQQEQQQRVQQGVPSINEVCGPIIGGQTLGWLRCVTDFNRKHPGWLEPNQARRLEVERLVQEQNAREQAEAERRRQMELEERRVRALEEAAQAQREQAETARRPRTCKTVGYERGRPIVECYYPDIPATR